MINPNIRKFVQWLNDWDFETCDSGDGETHDHECDREEAYVVIRCKPNRVTKKAHLLAVLLAKLHGVNPSPIGQGNCYIQATYDPVDNTAFIDVTGVTDDMLNEERL